METSGAPAAVVGHRFTPLSRAYTFVADECSPAGKPCTPAVNVYRAVVAEASPGATP
jgi:hypothetical protein